ncbi:type 1 fimbrial protein [Moellerella wisconsensis]|uniref:Type 1 fimbrial protein n=1 Tax=Moellerella wisconsensis TaxID=158849 RepID=A0A9Q8Q2D3_9GAMM|nr:type 1 fimbrial protein [Moellerella wisconsensis]UNH31779.1 type 1 fimbrial protein [Moellerella wisconsensis]UNH43450.1 type 1 fimbrial protein [Moellerella wisconsensis]WJW82782.1 type 1 fimbrial protein [Moellerella wisconsensis]
MILKKSLLSIAVLTATIGFSLNVNAADKNTADVTLSGLISAVTCDIDVNGVSGGTTVDTGRHITSDFEKKVNSVVGTPVPMVVTLKNCETKNSKVGSGNLYISGTTAPNGNNNIFVGNNPKTGFMVLKTDKVTSADAIKNDEPVPLNITGYTGDEGPGTNGGASYTFNVAMASTIENPTAGLYTAPIIISYASE